MTDRHRVYTKVLKMLKQMLELSHQGHVVTLAMMITGIVMGHKAQLSVMSSEVPVSAKEKSVEMRLRRWVKHRQIDADAIFMPFARQILEALSSAPLVLVMDGSQAGRNCMVLMVGVLYKKRALPIAWVVYRGKKGHTTAARHIQVLEKVQALIPEGKEVVLLGDAEYDTTEMLLWLQENHDVAQDFPRLPTGGRGFAAERLAFAHREGQHVRGLVALPKDAVELADLAIVGEHDRKLHLGELETAQHALRPAAHDGARGAAKSFALLALRTSCTFATSCLSL